MPGEGAKLTLFATEFRNAAVRYGVEEALNETFD
jgi:hypothetical protein